MSGLFTSKNFPLMALALACVFGLVAVLTSQSGTLALAVGLGAFAAIMSFRNWWVSEEERPLLAEELLGVHESVDLLRGDSTELRQHLDRMPDGAPPNHATPATGSLPLDDRLTVIERAIDELEAQIERLDTGLDETEPSSVSSPGQPEEHKALKALSEALDAHRGETSTALTTQDERLRTLAQAVALAVEETRAVARRLDGDGGGGGGVSSAAPAPEHQVEAAPAGDRSDQPTRSGETKSVGAAASGLATSVAASAALANEPAAVDETKLPQPVAAADVRADPTPVIQPEASEAIPDNTDAENAAEAASAPERSDEEASLVSGEGFAEHGADTHADAAGDTEADAPPPGNDAKVAMAANDEPVSDSTPVETAASDSESDAADLDNAHPSGDTEAADDADESASDPVSAFDPARIDNRYQLMLQPIFSLPENTPLYYEAYTRTLGANGQPNSVATHIAEAKQRGDIAHVDNILFNRSVGVVEQMRKTDESVLVFCNLAIQTLRTEGFLRDFLKFIGRNRRLGENLVLEFSQQDIGGISEQDLAVLQRIRDKGFRFSLDHISDWSVDIERLAQYGFRFMKLDSADFLQRVAQVGGSAERLLAAFDALGLQLIVEKIQDSAELDQVEQAGARFAQGVALGEPTLMRVA